jgi:catechol 2,3-dioxygenase-like lactoylglutathione lyase family enzyme
MEATIRYWRDLLGMKMTIGLGRPGYRQYFFSISDADMIAFFEWPEVEPKEIKDHGVPVKGPEAFDHVSFGVAEQAGLWELKARLEAAGFWVSEVVDHGFIHSLYSFDPNNIPVEFSWAVPGVDVRKRPRLVDSSPSRAPLEGPDSQPGHWPEADEPAPEDERIVYPGAGEEVMDENKNRWSG